jgi:hypothetical protein
MATSRRHDVAEQPTREQLAAAILRATSQDTIGRRPDDAFEWYESADGMAAAILAALEPAAWVIPPWAEPPAEGEKVASCRSCGAEVMWVLTKAGRRAPINRDGTSHFSNCPQADSWRRKEAPRGPG